MEEAEKYKIANEICLAKFIKKYTNEYNDVELTNGQLYTLYQQAMRHDEVEDIVDIINNAAAEPLP